MIASLHRFRRLIGMDRAVFYTASARVWQFSSGLLTLWFIGTFLTKDAQGFYYTFASIIGLQTFLELGLSQSIIQTASHEFAHLSFATDGRISGDAIARKRLLSVGKLSLRWYGTIALILLIVIAPAGWWFFASKDVPGVPWTIPWWLLCALAALSLQITPLLFLLEGCGQIASVNAARFWTGIAATLSTWYALASGAGLFACVVQAAVQFAGLAIFLRRMWWPFIRDIVSETALAARVFVREIWGFQWRIAVSWMCGYFTMSAVTPILFQLHGPQTAGRFGMTMQAVGGVTALAFAWTSSKGPAFGTLIAQRRFAELDTMFRRALIQSIGVAALGSVCVFTMLAALNSFTAFGERFLPLSGVAFLCASAVAVQVTSGTAVYLRAHKREPFMVLSIIVAISAVVGVSGFGLFWAGTGAAFGYFLANGVISPLLAAFTFRRRRIEWHAAA